MRIRYAKRANPPAFAAEELAVRRARYPRIKARRAFEFAPNADRRRALSLIEKGRVADAEFVLKALDSDDYVLRRAGAYFLHRTPLLMLHPEYEPKLRKLLSHPDRYVVLAAEDAISNLRPIPENRIPFGTNEKLLGSAGGHLAAGDMEVLGERLGKIREITKQLQKEFGKNFTGVLVFGSTSKGYVRDGSDLDYRILGSPAARRRFLQLAETKSLLPYSEENKYDHCRGWKKIGGAYALFTGLFFGDRGKLLQMQRNAVSRLDQNKWEGIAEQVGDRETNIGDAFTRIDVPAFAEERIRNAIRLNRAPPTLAEVKLILKRQANARIRSRRRFAGRATATNA
ncbi:Uncharacterised protein [Candidatus Norongarragalina meridionalis]|nr:Uncharacterised protein [Candidatus Norongarragalina meridionalis]